jgi:hypothetical protein
MSRARCVAGFAVLCALGACKTTGLGADGRGRTWFSGAASIVQLHGDDDLESADSGGAFTIEGGYDLWTTELLRAGWEIGATWSRYDVEPQGSGGEHYDLDVAHWSLGARASLALPPIEGVLFVNGGMYFRDEAVFGDDNDYYDESDGSGVYFGAGLEWWFDRIGRMGPMVRAYQDSDSDAYELLVGMSVTFYP